VNDVKYLCDLTLDVEAPPLREASQVLAAASRASARRNRAVAATVGLAGVTVAAALAVPALLPSRPASPAPFVAVPATQPPSALPSAAPVPVPSAKASATHDRAVYDLLVAALPAGYTGRTQYPFATPGQSPIRLDMPSGSMLVTMSARVVVSDGHGEGNLWAYVGETGTALPTGELCAVPDAGRECQVVDVAGVPVVVWLEDDGLGGEAIVARRYLHGGHLGVVAQRSVVEYSSAAGPSSHGPSLAAAFLTPQQVAALAGNPAMLP
jgi:hypothetical protein